MKVAEIRSRFLNFFNEAGHTVVESASLVPANDPTLLFTNAGMVPFKDVFLGKERRDYVRATSAQKCVRAGGKHNDLENVGFTARHHTFFEMLGNFSFGDYFKEEAIRLAWQFVTQELKISPAVLYATVFREDDEAYNLWRQKIGLAADRVFRLDEKDNFWAMGDTGPCGPCSEIFVDRGAQYGCQQPTCQVGCECDRFMEIWNLVFMQYERNAQGDLKPLPKPSVDTGAGLERIASVLQGVASNYDIDIFTEIMRQTAAMVGKSYDPASPERFPFRVIADHARAATFLIGDGVMPSNEGRGYVLRRIIRRAVRYGRNLGFAKPFLHQVSGFVIDQMASAYADLESRRSFIAKALLAEEEQFFRTLERGLSLLDEEIPKAKAQGILSGDVAFKLYDTFGFPLDLTRIIVTEQGLKVDEAGFEQAMERQKAQSRQHWKGSGEERVADVYFELKERLREEGRDGIRFVGYEAMGCEGVCLGIVGAPDGGEAQILEDSLGVETFSAVFSPTPFYGESGGQVGDRGRIVGHGFEGEVLDVTKPTPELVVAKIKTVRGSIKAGLVYLQETDRAQRALTARNHTATHLLHWALREVLGDHVKQAGSLVTRDSLRFDFSHFNSVTAEELRRIEGLINAKIWAAAPVHKLEMAKEEALKAGAIAFFGEKYGATVRVVSVGDFSTELCGGTHVDNAGDIHLFTIVSEASIAAGVRRIVAMTSEGAFRHLKQEAEELQAVRERLKATTLLDIETKIDKMATTERELRKELEALKSVGLDQEVDALLKTAQELAGAPFLALVLEPLEEGAKRLRDITEILRKKSPSTIAVLGIEDPQAKKAFLVASAGKSAPKGFHANTLINRLAPLIEGRGGGKPDLAQAGGAKVEGLKTAIADAPAIIKDMLGL